MESRVELTYRHYFTTCPLYRELSDHVSDAELHLRASSEMDRMILQIVAMVAGERVDEIKYPMDWREAFKERWFPMWALKRWPIRYHIWKLDIHYPKLKVRRDGVFRLYHNRTSDGYPHFEDTEEGEAA